MKNQKSLFSLEIDQDIFCSAHSNYGPKLEDQDNRDLFYQAHFNYSIPDPGNRKQARPSFTDSNNITSSIYSSQSQSSPSSDP